MTKKQKALIKRLERLLFSFSKEGLILYGQNSNLNVAKEKDYDLAMNRENPFSGRIEMDFGFIKDSGVYRDSGADDTIYID